MKAITLLLIKIILITISLALLGIGCSKDEVPPNETNTDQTDNEIMTDIFTVMAGDSNSFLDISPIPIQQELEDYAKQDTNFYLVLESIRSYNELLENPGELLRDSLKSAHGGWKKIGCENIGILSECTWEQNGGAYIYRITQTNSSLTRSIIRDTYISGTRDKIFYGTLGKKFYHISRWTTTFNDFQITIDQNFGPIPEQTYEKPWVTYIFRAGETKTIHTPWGGQEIIKNAQYQNFMYAWDPVNGYHERIVMLSEWNGDLLSTLVSIFCLQYKSVRPFHVSTYNFDKMEGSSCTYDCDGLPIDCDDL